MLPSAVCIRTAQGFCPKTHACGQTQMDVGQGIFLVTPELGPRANFRTNTHSGTVENKQENPPALGRQGKQRRSPWLSFLPLYPPTMVCMLEMKASNSLVRQNIRSSPCISSLGVRRDSVWAGYIYKTAVSDVSVAISSQC